MTNTYKGYPIAKVIATQKALEKRLFHQELEDACHVRGICGSVITLNLNNGTVVHVIRQQNWKAALNDYEMSVDVYETHGEGLDSKLTYLHQHKYMKSNPEGLMDTAAAIIGLSYR